MSNANDTTANKTEQFSSDIYPGNEADVDN